MRKSLYPLLLVCVFNTYSSHATPPPKKTIIMATTVALMVVGIWYWFSHNNDEAMLKECLERQQFFTDILGLTYDHLVTYVPNYDDSDYEPIDHSFARKYFIATIPESILYQIAMTLHINQQAAQEYMRFINRLSRELKQNSSILQKRKATLQSSEQQKALVKSIDMLLDLIKEAQFKKDLVCDCMNHHGAYFALYEFEAIVRTTFLGELAVIQQQPNNRDQLVDAIKGAVEQKRCSYTEYIAMLDDYSAQLQQALKKTPVRYKERLAWGRWVVDALEYIKITACALASHQYEMLLPDYQRNIKKA